MRWLLSILLLQASSLERQRSPFSLLHPFQGASNTFLSQNHPASRFLAVSVGQAVGACVALQTAVTSFNAAPQLASSASRSRLCLTYLSLQVLGGLTQNSFPRGSTFTPPSGCRRRFDFVFSDAVLLSCFFEEVFCF